MRGRLFASTYIPQLAQLVGALALVTRVPETLPLKRSRYQDRALPRRCSRTPPTHRLMTQFFGCGVSATT